MNHYESKKENTRQFSEYFELGSTLYAETEGSTEDSTIIEEDTVESVILSKSDFIFSTLSYVIGFGNIWKFPYLFYKYGGSAFLIPYLICLFFVGIPLCCIEMSLGQFTSTGVYKCYNIIPALRGISICYFIVSVTGTYYTNGFICWALYYLLRSFNRQLPWASCGNWSSSLCETNLIMVANKTCSLEDNLILYDNGTCYNITSKILHGINDLAKSSNIRTLMSAEDFYNEVGFAKETTGRSFLGAFRYDLALCLLFAWFIIYLVLNLVNKKSQIFLKICFMFPGITLTVLFALSIMQRGSAEGIIRYLTPDTKQLAGVDIWHDALLQVFFSLSISLGGHSVYASKNDFHNNIIRDAVLVGIVDTMFSLYASFVAFNFIGALSKNRGISIDHAFKSGLKLVYVLFPQVFIGLPTSWFWSIIFFTMIAFLSLGTQMGLVITVISILLECFPNLKKHEATMILASCFVSYLSSLTLATEKGYKLVLTLAQLTTSWNLMAIAFLNCLIVVCYGPCKFENNITFMLHSSNIKNEVIYTLLVRHWLIPCWCFISPVIIIFCFIYHLLFDEASNPVIWAMTALFQIVSIMPVIISWIYAFSKTSGHLLVRLRRVMTPSNEWGPMNLDHRRQIHYINVASQIPNDMKHSTFLKTHSV